MMPFERYKNRRGGLRAAITNKYLRLSTAAVRQLGTRHVELAYDDTTERIAVFPSEDVPQAMKISGNNNAISAVGFMDAFPGVQKGDYDVAVDDIGGETALVLTYAEEGSNE